MQSGQPVLDPLERITHWSPLRRPALPRPLQPAEHIPPVVPLSRHADGVWYAADMHLPPQTISQDVLPPPKSRPGPYQSQGYTSGRLLAADVPPKGRLIDLAV